jgi:hypothetical protein
MTFDESSLMMSHSVLSLVVVRELVSEYYIDEDARGGARQAIPVLYHVPRRSYEAQQLSCKLRLTHSCARSCACDIDIARQSVN